VNSDLPEGFRIIPDVLSPAEEQPLLDRVEQIDWREVRMRGVVAKRTVMHYGWDYDYERWRIVPADEVAPWLNELRDRGAGTAGLDAAVFEQVLVARYPAGAGIGWHRDAPMFGPVVLGFSLASPVRMRFRDGSGSSAEAILEPRSLYILSGPARSRWQHSIPPVRNLRYSVTFRSVHAGWKRRALAEGAEPPPSPDRRTQGNTAGR
jgi:DNA oxidative demethylase